MGGVLLALQALLWGGGQILEAKPAAAALMVVAHVEEPGSATCPPLHQHVDCLVCRTFHSGAASGAPPRLPLADQDIGTPASASVASGRASPPVGGVGSRAPPCAIPLPGIA